MNEILERFEKLGYRIQEPTDRDRNYFFAKQTNTGHRFIWLQVKKTPEVEVQANYQPSELTVQETELILELVCALGYDTYRIK